jgi:hypothetical protein
MMLAEIVLTTEGAVILNRFIQSGRVSTGQVDHACAGRAGDPRVFGSRSGIAEAKKPTAVHADPEI